MWEDGPVILAEELSYYLAKRTSYEESVSRTISKRQIKRRMNAESSLEDILDTVFEETPGHRPFRLSIAQIREEIRALSQIVREASPKTVLEIGTASGGTFYVWCRYFDSATHFVSLDLPGGRFGGGYEERKTSIYNLFAPGRRADFVRANSHEGETLTEVSELIDGQVDFLFIDGDHTYEGVKQDFEMYSPLVADDGIIALHDIVEHPNDPAVAERRQETVDDLDNRYLMWSENHVDCNVDDFWDELQTEYETEEIISHPKQTSAGIGVVYL
jgi:predicted O-methyltransferase YrrM